MSVWAANFIDIKLKLPALHRGGFGIVCTEAVQQLRNHVKQWAMLSVISKGSAQYNTGFSFDPCYDLQLSALQL